MHLKLLQIYSNYTNTVKIADEYRNTLGLTLINDQMHSDVSKTVLLLMENSTATTLYFSLQAFSVRRNMTRKPASGKVSAEVNVEHNLVPERLLNYVIDYPVALTNLVLSIDIMLNHPY